MRRVRRLNWKELVFLGILLARKTNIATGQFYRLVDWGVELPHTQFPLTLDIHAA
jgi:hypothetical protein